MGNGSLFCHAGRSEYIDVAKLVLGVGEVFHLHQAFFHERFEAVVQPAHADAQFFSQLALGEVGVVLQQAHDAEVGVFLKFGLAAGHEMASLRSQ